MFGFGKKKLDPAMQKAVEDLAHAEENILIHESLREHADHSVNMYSERAARLRSWISGRQEQVSVEVTNNVGQLATSTTTSGAASAVRRMLRETAQGDTQRAL